MYKAEISHKTYAFTDRVKNQRDKEDEYSNSLAKIQVFEMFV